MTAELQRKRGDISGPVVLTIVIVSQLSDEYVPVSLISGYVQSRSGYRCTVVGFYKFITLQIIRLHGYISDAKIITKRNEKLAEVFLAVVR